MPALARERELARGRRSKAFRGGSRAQPQCADDVMRGYGDFVLGLGLSARLADGDGCGQRRRELVLAVVSWAERSVWPRRRRDLLRSPAFASRLPAPWPEGDGGPGSSGASAWRGS